MGARVCGTTCASSNLEGTLAFDSTYQAVEAEVAIIISTSLITHHAPYQRKGHYTSHLLGRLHYLCIRVHGMCSRGYML